MFFNIFKKKVKPYNEGYLPKQDGHKIYYAEFGNPKGEVVLFFHGGPGYWSSPKHATIYDLKRFRVVLFDQRGSGKSLPAGSIENNNTQKTLSDAKRLLEHLNINEKIIVSGNSWGSSLALLFAEENPKLIDKMILSKIFLADEMNRDWIFKYTNYIYPELYEKVESEALGSKKSLIKYYQDLINSKDLAEQVKAVSLFFRYEGCLSSMNPSLELDEVSIEEIDFARIYINYLANKFYIKDNQIMDNIKKIKDIDTLILHNRIDLVCPLKNAHILHKSLINSKLVIVPSFGHSSDELSKTTKQEIEKFLK